MLDTVIQVVVQSTLAVLVPLVAAVIVQMLRRLHIQITADQELLVTARVRQAAQEAEEWAAARVKAKLPVTSHQKLTRATESLVKPFGLTVEEAEVRLRASLVELGLGATAKAW